MLFLGQPIIRKFFFSGEVRKRLFNVVNREFKNRHHNILEIQRLQLAGSSSTVFAVNLIQYSAIFALKQPRLALKSFQTIN